MLYRIMIAQVLRPVLFHGVVIQYLLSVEASDHGRVKRCIDTDLPENFGEKAKEAASRFIMLRACRIGIKLHY